MAKSLEEQLKSIMKSKANSVNSKILEIEGKRLKDFLQNRVDEYYGSYIPTQYIPRTDRFKNSIKVSAVHTVHGVSTIKVYFDRKMATHESVINGADIYVPKLLDLGWKWGKQPSKPIYRFTYYDGFHFMEKAVQDFNKKNPYKLRIKIEG